MRPARTAPLPLTHQQQACMRLIQDLTDASGGVPPSLNEIGSRMGRGKTTGFRLTSQLIEKGWVERILGRSRGLVILHRLAPTPQQAVSELIGALDAAIPSPDGTVRVALPKEMISRAVRALAAANGGAAHVD